MPIQLQDTAGLLSSIIVLCFSFCIPVLTIWFKKAEFLPKMLGYSFIPLFAYSLISLLVTDYKFSAVLSQTAEPLLLLLFILIFTGLHNKWNTTISTSGLALIPVILAITALASMTVRTFLSLSLTSVSISVAASVIIMYLIKNKKGELNLLFWAVLPFMAASLAQYYLTSGIIIFVVPLLKLSAYTLMLIYFYQALYISHFLKVGEAEKKLAAINRSIEYEVKKRMMEIEKVNQNLVNISKTDSMSKVMNKAALLDSLDNMINSKPGTEFSILMFDIDNFKVINDTLGHVTGDKCIKMLAATARNNIRDIDLIGRYGGDEFIIILPGTAADQAVTIAERFRERIAASDSPHYTVSIGIATYPADGQDMKSLVEAADEGLYRSKRKGRNAVSHRNFH
jgi:diguanylate cyclase (GGDEF)-like protein